MTSSNNELRQARLDILSRMAADDLDNYLIALGAGGHALFWTNRRTKMGPCPIHGGNNPTSFQIYVNDELEGGEGVPPLVWRCYSGHCHERYGANLIGLTMALLRTEEFKKALSFLLSWTGKWQTLEDVEVDLEALEKRTFFPPNHNTDSAAKAAQRGLFPTGSP